jgi:hypothetical protein
MFTDYIKAVDMAKHQKQWTILQNKGGIPFHLTELFKIYVHTNICIQHRKKGISTIYITRGV